MADEPTSPASGPEGGSGLATTTLPASGTAQTGQAGNGDARLAEILARKAKGETLNHSDRGYLGTVKRKAARLSLLVTPAPAVQNLLLDTPGNPDNPLFESGPEVPPAAPVPVPAAYDSALIHRTTESILEGVDKVTQDLIAAEFKKAGADASTVEVWKDAVAMKQAKTLMVEGSDPVIIWLCERFKCAPEQLETKVKGSGFVGGLALWGYGIFSAVKAAKEFQAEKLKRDAKP